MTDPDERPPPVFVCIRKAWRQQLDNPALPIVAYLGVIGLLLVLSGGVAPDAVQDATPRWLGMSWSVSLAVGGFLAVGAGLTGRTRGESAGLAMLLFGLGLYGLAAVFGAGDGDDATGLVALMACVAMRMRVLHLARKAIREAQRLDGDPWTS